MVILSGKFRAGAIDIKFDASFSPQCCPSQILSIVFRRNKIIVELGIYACNSYPYTFPWR